MVRSCNLCRLPLLPDTAVVRWATGLFPADDPDIFVEDEVSRSLEGEAHLDCFVSKLSDDDPGTL